MTVARPSTATLISSRKGTLQRWDNLPFALRAAGFSRPPGPESSKRVPLTQEQRDRVQQVIPRL